MMSSTLRAIASLSALAVLGTLYSCTGASTASSAKAESDGWQSEFDVDKSDLASSGTNDYFVLEPGFRTTFEGLDGKKHAKLVITVLDETERVDGVDTRVVEERESTNDELVEVSRNYFAISKRTKDVFYFGEDVDIYKGGRVVKHEGAWRSGVDGAKFGLVMPGRVEVGRKYHQEIAPGVAMDRFEISSTTATFETPAGRFENCVLIEETSPLEPGDRESKHYARGIGLIQDENLLLVEHGKISTKR